LDFTGSAVLFFWAVSLCLVAGCLFLAVRGIACTRLTARLPLSCELLHSALSGRSIQQAEGRRITQMNDFLEPRTLGSQRTRNHLGRSALPRYQRSPYRLALGGRCQKPQLISGGFPIPSILLILSLEGSRRADSKRPPAPATNALVAICMRPNDFLLAELRAYPRQRKHGSQAELTLTY
jgi:hypothetical protein